MDGGALPAPRWDAGPRYREEDVLKLRKFVGALNQLHGISLSICISGCAKINVKNNSKNNSSMQIISEVMRALLQCFHISEGVIFRKMCFSKIVS